MNIFILDKDPVIAAKYCCDKHVVKMIVESVGLLSNAMWSIVGYGPYKKSHYNHPCSIWARSSLENYQWLWLHCHALGKEYTERYNKFHKSHQTLLKDVPFELSFEKKDLTPFMNCTPYKDIADIVEAYRHYYRIDKRYFAKWKNNNCPDWF